MEIIITLIILTVLTFVNIILPLSGSSTVTPLLTLFTTPHNAIALTSFYFVLSGIVRIFLFRKEIKFAYVKKLLPISIIGSILGALSLVKINEKLLGVVIISFLLYFIYKKIKGVKKDLYKNTSKLSSGAIGIFSGFLQGMGLAGSDLRSGYLYSEKLSVLEVSGTSAFIGTSNFLMATLVRLHTNQVKLVDLSILLYLLPSLIIATYAGRKVLLKIDRKNTDRLIVIILLVTAMLLTLKMFGIKLF